MAKSKAKAVVYLYANEDEKIILKQTVSARLSELYQALREYEAKHGIKRTESVYNVQITCLQMFLKQLS